SSYLLVLRIPPPPTSTPFPYTTLFRSSEAPKPGGGGFVTREVSKVKGFYRGETLVLLEYNSELTLNLEGKESSVTNSTTYFVVADRKSTRLNSSHVKISYAVFCLKKKK